MNARVCTQPKHRTDLDEGDILLEDGSGPIRREVRDGVGVCSNVSALGIEEHVCTLLAAVLRLKHADINALHIRIIEVEPPLHHTGPINHTHTHACTHTSNLTE